MGEFLEGVMGWVEGLGFWAPVVYGVLYAACVVLMVPGAVLTAGAGVLFGLGLGTGVVSVGSTLGAALAFLLGRYVARGWVERRLEGRPRFRAIDEAVARGGWRVVLLTRLSPVFPFNLLNYAYGVTRVGLAEYVAASWAGMLPGTVVYVYLGTLGRAALDAGGKGAAEWALLGVGLAATVGVAVLVTRAARRALSFTALAPPEDDA